MAGLLDVSGHPELVERYNEMVQKNWFRFVIYKLSPDFKELLLDVPGSLATSAKLAIEGHKRKSENMARSETKGKAKHEKEKEEPEHNCGDFGILPNEILVHLVHLFDAKSLCAMSSVSKFFHYLCTDIGVWGNLVRKELSQDNVCGWVKNWEDMIPLLPQDQPRFAIFMWEKPTRGGTLEHVDPYFPLFVYWCPDSCSIRSKMIYSSTKVVVKKLLMGSEVRVEAQATESSELAREVIDDLLARMYFY